MLLTIDISRIQDIATKDAMQRIKEFIAAFPLFNGNWQFYEFVFTKGQDNIKIPHGLTFKPIDVIQTAIIGDAGVIWNYSLFDTTNLNLTVSSACTVRAFIGRYEIGGT